MKKTIQIFLLLVFCIFIGKSTIYAQNSEVNKEGIIKDARLEIVCSVTEYLWVLVNPGDATFPQNKIDCNDYAKIGDFITSEFKNDKTDKNKNFLNAVLKQEEYMAGKGNKKTKFVFKVNYNDFETLSQYVKNIEAALIKNETKNRTDKDTDNTVFEKLINDLNGILNEANKELVQFKNTKEIATQKIIIEPDGDIELIIGEIKTITISLSNPDLGNYTHQVEGDKNIIKVTDNKTGITITGIKKGEAKINICPTVGDENICKSITVKVKPIPTVHVNEISFLNPPESIIVDQEKVINFKISPLDAKYNKIHFEADPVGIIKQMGGIGNNKVKIKGIASGKSTTLKIYAENNNGKRSKADEFTIEVVEYKNPIKKIKITNKKNYENSLFVGENIKELKYDIEPQDEYTSSVIFEYPEFIDMDNKLITKSGSGDIVLYSSDDRDISDTVTINAIEREIKVQIPQVNFFDEKEKNIIDKFNSSNNKIKSYSSKSIFEIEFKELIEDLDYAKNNLLSIKGMFDQKEITELKIEDNNITKNKIIEKLSHIEKLQNNLKPKSDNSLILYILGSIIIILIIVLVLLSLKFNKIHDKLSEQLNSGKNSIKNKELEKSSLQRKYLKLQSDYNNLLKDDQFNKNKINELNKKVLTLQSTTSSFDSNKNGIQKEPVIPPPKPKEIPKKYAFFPDSPDGFNLSNLTDNESKATIYILFIESDSSASFVINENPESQRRAMNDTSTLLEKACNYINGPNDGNSIQTITKGKLQKSGSIWKIIEKAIIKFV